MFRLLALFTFALQICFNDATFQIKVDISSLNMMDQNYQYYIRLSQGAAAVVSQMISPVQINTQKMSYTASRQFPLMSAITLPDMSNFPIVDLVVLVGQITDMSRPFLCIGQALMISQTIGRPTLGELIINIANFNSFTMYSNQDFQFHLRVFVRAYFKIMGLDMQLIYLWIQSTNSQPYSASQLTQLITVRGVQQIALITPNVLAKSRIHFGCTQNLGMALAPHGEYYELQWDPLVMNYEIMSALNFDTLDISISSMTLAALEDTGWYKPIYSKAEVPIWGHSEGCNFITQACPQSPLPSEFCPTLGQSSTDFSGLGQGTCVQYPTTSCNYIKRGSMIASPISPPAKLQCSSSNSCSQQGICSLDNNNCNCFDPTASGDCSCVSNLQFYQLSSMTCITCQSPCKQCTSAVTCLSCLTNFYYQTNTQQCLSKCLSGYALYDAQNPQVCQPCLTGCDVCSNINQCTQCNPSYGYYTVDSLCYIQCPKGTYKQTMASQAQCTNCMTGCLVCNDGLSCVSCSSSYYLSSAGCVPCSNGCLTCQSATICGSCSLNYLPVPSQQACVQACPTATYLDNSGIASCSQCQSGCQSCTNGTVCITCTSQFQSSPGGGCSSLCTNHCNICDPNQINNCSSCQSGYILTSTNSCLYAKCNSGQYMDIQLFICKLCGQGCKVCLDGKSCNYCFGGYYLDSNISMSTYGNCAPCQLQCATCSSMVSCSSCQFGYNYYALTQQCVKICPNQTTALLSVCQSCMNNCLICNNLSSCQVCMDNYYIGLGQTCLKCDTTCQNCVNTATNCTACSQNLLMVAGDQLCLQGCPSPTTLINQVCQCPSGFCRKNQNCVSCNAQCYQCFGVANNQCSACNANSFLIGTYVNNRQISGQCSTTCPPLTYPDSSSNKCQSCHQFCSTCFGPTSTTCNTCKQGYLLLNQTQTCIDQCPHNYFVDLNSTCSLCSDKCTQCAGPSENQCDECASNYFLAESSCLPSCPIGYTTNNTTKLCKICLTSFVMDTQICQDYCPENGYYRETFKRTILCKQCTLPNCNNCFDQYTCKECHDGYFLDDVVCTQCNVNCNTCTQRANKCTDCLSGSHLQTHDYTCTQDCTDQQFKLNGVCTECTQPCFTCVSKAKCTSCQSSFFLDNGVCQSSCSDGSYLIQSQGVCAKCDSSCMQCNGPDENQCVQCKATQLLMQNRCVGSGTAYQPKRSSVSSSVNIKPLIIITFTVMLNF